MWAVDRADRDARRVDGRRRVDHVHERAAPRHRHDASTASRSIGPFRTNDRMIVTEWEPGRVMGIEHRGLVHGHAAASCSQRRRPAQTALHLDGGAPRSRGGWAGRRRARRAAGPATRLARQPRRLADLVEHRPRMTNLRSERGRPADARRADVARRRPRSRRARLHLGLGRGGQRGRERCRCWARSVRSHRTPVSAPACSRLQLRTPPLHAMAARDAAATRGRSRRVPRRRYLVAGGRGPVARRGLRRPPDRAGARVRHAPPRVPVAARRSPSTATSTRSSASGSGCGSATANRRSPSPR